MVVLAARAIAIGLLGNAALKIGLVIALGAPAYRRLAAAGLLALAITGGAALWIFW
jgi:hypothetical protein